MDSIDHTVETYIRRPGLPLPRVTLGAVSRDGISYPKAVRGSPFH